MAAAGVVGLFVVAGTWAMEVRRPVWLFTGGLAGTLVLSAFAIARYRTIARVRIRMLVDRLEVVLFVAIGPLLPAAFNTFAWAADLVRS